VLPASSAALRQWSDEDPYVLFLRQQLELAEPFPAQANTTIMTALNTAVFDVLSLSETPQVAAEKAAAAITNP
jgi:hypothetical protein